MRTRLNQTEQIERYLSGDMAGAELKEFERLIGDNPELKAKIEARRNAAENLPAHANSRTYRFSKALALITLVALLTVGLFFAFRNNNESSPVVSELHDSLALEIPENPFRHSIGGLKTWVDPNVQEFSINGRTGGTIEGKDGMLIIVPTHAFLDKDGNKIDDDVNIELVEALSLEEMVLYNLGTTADGTPLESGGMFYLNATKNGKTVNINPERPLYIEVPTNDVKQGMMAFSGEVDADGNMNWKDPKPLKKYLATVDIELLDFLPEGFEDGVHGGTPFRNHKVADDKLVDSLYYSLSPSLEKPKRRIDCGIDPLSIKTIRTGKFQNTFVATAEFEARVQVLHDIKRGQRLFDLYINNLNKNLYEIDSMVMSRLSGSYKRKYKVFYEQKHTSIKDSEIYQEQLSAYYNRKKKEFADELTAVKNEFEVMKSKELNALYSELREVAKSYDVNGDAEKSAAIAKVIPNRLAEQPLSVATSQSYGMRWASLGWANIDCYLHMVAEDPKLVEIIAGVDKTEDTQVYQWLNAINTLTPLYLQGEVANAMFPKQGSPESERMRNTYTFAISENDNGYKWGMVKYAPYEVELIDISMKSTPIASIRKRLDELGGHASRVTEHLSNVKEMVKRQKSIRSAQRALRKDRKAREQYITNKIQRLQHRNYEEYMFIRKLKELAFPCPQPSLDGCFIEGTTISLINGEEKPIHFMKVGEEVLAYDTIQNKIITATVTKIHQHTEAMYPVRAIILNDARKTMVTCTDEHPFWTNGKWLSAEKLVAGDVVHILDEKSGELKPITISEIRIGKVVQDVYNISTTAKNYYANGILVHNK